MALFAQFLLRLAFGLAACMATVSPQWVASGYFRNHLYVTLGLSAMASLLLGSLGSPGLTAAIIAAVASYAGAVCWLYEMPRAGRTLLVVVAIAALTAAWQSDAAPTSDEAASLAAASESGVSGAASEWLNAAAPLTSGLVLGAAMAAMLLGHWYLNAPGMQLAPLRRLIALIAGAVALQAIVCGTGLALAASGAQSFDMPTWSMIAGRWAFGLLGVAALAWMARETLKIPNTQSATGILYVAVIGSFAGEMLSLMLSAQHGYPL